MNLFGDDAVEAATAARGGPDRGLVQQLEAYGYRAERVRTWSVARCRATLNARKKEEHTVRRAAAARAAEEDRKEMFVVPPPERGCPTGLERREAAAYLMECLAQGPDAIALAVMYSVACMRDDECRRLAEFMMTKFCES